MAQVQGEEIYLAHSGQEVDDNIDEVQAARGSEASLSARLAAIVGDVETDQQRQETEIGVVAALGAKNLLRDQSLNAASGTGVTITPNSDGTYTLSGTPTGTATYLYTPSSNFANLYGLEAGKEYTISAGSSKVLIRVDYSTTGTTWENTPLVNNLPESASFTLPQNAVGIYIRFRSTASGGSLNGIVLKQMICRAEITDDTFVLYAPTNRELYETKTEQTETNVIANLGAKNLLKVTSATQTINGVTFTVNNDQTITVNGTNTGTSTALFVINDIPLQSGIAYTLSGCPSGGSTATYYIGSLDTTDWQEFTTDIGNGGTATLSEPKTIRFRIGIRSGVTVNNLVFKPMLRRAEITDSTYVPYAPTNRELYEMILALQSGVSVQSSAASLMQTGRIDAEMTDAGTDEEEEER